MEEGAIGLSRIIEIPAVKVSDSMMFGYPTRMVDAWNPSVERLLMPGFTNKARTVRLTITHNGLTYAELPKPGRLGPWPRFKRQIRQKIGDRGNPVDVPEKIVFDLRSIDSGNVAHFAHAIMLPMYMIKKNLDRTDLERDILCVFPKRPNELTVKLIEYFKLNAIFTDSAVCGSIASLNDVNNDKKFFCGAIPLLAKYPIPNYNSNTPRKIFISRRNSRTLTNEDQISDYLKELGFEHQYFEDLDLCDQFSIGRNVTDVVAIHGAALGTLAFNATASSRNEKQLRLIELFSPAFVVNPFRQYAAVLGGKWVGVRGQITPQIIKELDDWNGVSKSAFESFNIDVNSLKIALDYINS